MLSLYFVLGKSPSSELKKIEKTHFVVIYCQEVMCLYFILIYCTLGVCCGGADIRFLSLAHRK